MSKSLIFTAMLAAVALGSTAVAGASDRQGGFTFRDAEFMPLDQGVEAATRFVADRLPPGLPLSQARRRLMAARMTCNTATLCDFTELVHIQGGQIGEDNFTVRLAGDGRGNLVSATLDHFTVGVGEPNP